MKSVIGFLVSRWFLSFLGALLAALLVWFLGPLLAFLAGVIVRAAIVVVIFLLWFGINFWISRRNKAADSALAKGVAEAPAADPTAAASAEEVAALSEKLKTALALLQKARGSRGYLYEQPWYVIIGPPGAGKTTALLNAGLKFPLAAEMGQGAVAGVGGTRLCDWWFTEQAVMIDTAGRYTTQDSDAAVDRAGWEGFLALLRRTRTRQPLNGVIVAIALSDIAAAPRDERLAHARAIRRRVKELGEKLGVRVPVYALFTKADLIAGFTEFFDDLDRERRAQVWGTTFPLGGGEAGPVAGFGAEFRALVARLDARLFDRLQAERSPERRAMIAGFPAQVASLEAPLAEFLQEAFGGSRLDPAPFLRGVYLTSGTQEGTPIDRLTGVLARAFGVDQRRAPSLRPEQGRSYFLGGLLSGVIFGEAMLVSARPEVVRRRRLVRLAGFAAALVVLLGGGAVLFAARSGQAAAVAQSQAALASYDKLAQGIALDPVTSGDLRPIVPLLDAARALPYGYGAGESAPGAGAAWGLSQIGKLRAGARQVYRDALGNAMLPRLIARLEAQMRGNLDRPDFLYQATRVYLMLGGQGPLDRALVEEWMKLDWENVYPGPLNAPLRADLGQHLVALLSGPLPAVSLDGGLIAAARTAFSRVPLAQRVYSRIRPSAAAQAVPAWVPANVLGGAGVPLFTRTSGKPLTEGIAGFFTVKGFYDVLLPELPLATKEVASESWVLGRTEEVAPGSAQAQNLETDVIRLYETDYERAWDRMLADLQIAPMTSLAQASQALFILASPQSPMKVLLASVARQLTLDVPPKPPPGVKPPAGLAAQGAGALAGGAASLKGLLGAGGAAAAPAAPPGSAVAARYKALREFVNGGPGAPINIVLPMLGALQQQLAALASVPAGGAAAPAAVTGPDPTAMLKNEAAQAPQPVARWLEALAVSGNALRGGGARQQVAAAFTGAGGPAMLCQKAVDGRYPFFPGATNEIPLADFAHLFAPGGLLDSFFNTQLRPFVDTSGAAWRPQAVNGVAAPVSPGDVAEFQRAAVIRDLFFAAGGTAPSVSFTITPLSLDDGAKQVTLEMGALTVTYAHGPPRGTAVTWPGPSGMNHVRLVFDPPPPGGTGVLQASGPWALFRLFNQGSLAQQGGAENFVLSFQIGVRQASFSIQANSVFNPFSPGVLQDFRCPVLH